MAGLDKKTTELVLIALLTMERWKTGLQVHAKMATVAGCTAEEVRGAALITLAVLGSLSVLKLSDGWMRFCHSKPCTGALRCDGPGRLAGLLQYSLSRRRQETR